MALSSQIEVGLLILHVIAIFAMIPLLFLMPDQDHTIPVNYYIINLDNA